MNNSRSRGWAWTLNNYTEVEVTELDNIVCDYIIYGKESGADKHTPHLQGYIYFKNAISFSSIKKKLPKRCHIEPANGSPQQNVAYCSKEGDTKVRGTQPTMGKRTDLIAIKDAIVKGETTVDQIALEDPIVVHQYGRVLDRIEDIAHRSKYRTEMTTCDWLTGSTGSGKSHKAFQNFDPATHYLLNTEDKGWWDGYTGQETVIINDFKGEIRYGQMLQLIDKWPYSVPRRNRQPMPFTSKHIIITSILTPMQAYKNLSAADGIDQLLRRIHVVNIDTEVVRGNTVPGPDKTIEENKRIIDEINLGRELHIIRKEDACYF